MSYVSPGIWTYTVPATVMLTDAGPWLGLVQVYDQNGNAGTLFRSFYYQFVERD